MCPIDTDAFTFPPLSQIFGWISAEPDNEKTSGGIKIEQPTVQYLFRPASILVAETSYYCLLALMDKQPSVSYPTVRS